MGGGAVGGCVSPISIAMTRSMSDFTPAWYHSWMCCWYAANVKSSTSLRIVILRLAARICRRSLAVLEMDTDTSNSGVDSSCHVMSVSLA